MRRPVRDVARKLFQHQRGAFAAAIRRWCWRPRRAAMRFSGHPMQRPITDQVADIRCEPIRAGLDELIVVELFKVLLEPRELLGDSASTSARSGLPCSLVADAIDRRQQRVETIGREAAHGISSSCWNGAGSSVSNSAARARPPSTRMRDASSLTWCDGHVCCERLLAAVQPRDVQRDDTWDRLRHGNHIRLLHRLAKIAIVERVMRAQPRFDGGEHRRRLVGRVAFNLETETERARLMRQEHHRDMRIATGPAGHQADSSRSGWRRQPARRPARQW